MNKLCEVVVGSRLHGTFTETSDVDRVVVFLPNIADQMLSGYKEGTHIWTEKTITGDITYMSLQRFLFLAASGDTLALDILNANEDRVTSYSNVWPMVVSCKEVFVTKKLLSCLSFAKHQVHKYIDKARDYRVLRYWAEGLMTLDANKKLGDELKKGECMPALNETEDGSCLIIAGKKYPFGNLVKHVLAALNKRIGEYGVRVQEAATTGADWKSISHACRLVSELEEVLDTGSVTFPRTDRALLKDLKLGTSGLKPEDVCAYLEIKVTELTKRVEESSWPEEVTQSAVLDVINRAYSLDSMPKK